MQLWFITGESAFQPQIINGAYKSANNWVASLGEAGCEVSSKKLAYKTI